MSDTFTSGPARVTVHGMQAFRLQLAELPERMRKGVMRRLMRDAMVVVREDARRAVPVLSQPVLDGAGRPKRLPGTVRRAVSVRTSTVEDRSGNVGGFVNVRPLKGNVYRGRGPGRVLVRKSQRGADNPRDPYYWRWLEFGTKVRKTRAGKNLGAVRPYRFLQQAADKLREAAARFEKGMAAWVAKTNQSGRVE